MTLNSKSSLGSQPPPRMVSSNWCAHSRPSIAVMPHQPSAVNLYPSPIGFAPTVPPEVVQPLYDMTLIAAELPSLKEQPKHVTHPAGHVHRLPRFHHPPAFLHSPVTRLPPEILAYIFEFYVICGIELTPISVSAQGPFCLAKVCKLWRAIVESNPRLWTSIQVYFPDSHRSREEDVPRVKPLLDLHLKQSGILPISLTFTDHRIYHSATEDLITLLVDRLRMHARRWKRISLRLSCSYFPLLFTFTPCDLSSLEHLHISGDVVAQRIVTTLRLNLESATKLKSFTYSGPGRSVDDEIHLHWENLVEVSFEFAPHNGTSSTLSRQFRHLAQCQNITTCSLGIDRPFWPGLIGSQTITLPCLQTLRVRRLSTDSHARTAIDPLILPQLRTLEVDASSLVGWNERWHERAFSDLLARSGCSLHHLSIQDVDFPNHELVRCLALSHELTSFRFIPCPRSQNIGDIIRKLDVSRTVAGGQIRTNGHRQGRVANGDPLIPRLREITLASSIEEYLDLMTEMFHSRVGARAHAAGVATLRRAEVVFFDMSHDTDMDRVSVPGARLGRLASFRAEHLARWVSENKNGNEREDDSLVASVVIDSPYLAEYIDVQ